jgi:hypothetical protein
MGQQGPAPYCGRRDEAPESNGPCATHARQFQRLNEFLTGFAAEHITWQESHTDDFPANSASGKGNFSNDGGRVMAQLRDEVFLAFAPIEQEGGFPATIQVGHVTRMNQKGEPGRVMRQVRVHVPRFEGDREGSAPLPVRPLGGAE